MDAISALLQFATVWLAAQYLLGPVLIRFQLTTPSPFLLPRLDWMELVKTLGPSFAAEHEALVRLGFVPTRGVEVPGVKAVQYVHPTDAAMASLRSGKNHLSVCFTQEYAGGTCLLVGNSNLPSVYFAWSKRVSYGFPGVETAVVFEGFKRIRDRTALGERLHWNDRQDIAAIEAYMNAEVSFLVERGYYSRTQSNGKRRITFMGACYAAWRLAWPSKPILLYLQRRRAEQAAA